MDKPKRKYMAWPERGPATLIFLFANLRTAIALFYYDLAYMPHAIYHFKAYNIIYTQILLQMTS